MLFSKDDVQREVDNLIKIRNEFYNYLDQNIPKKDFNIYDFSTKPTLDAEEVYQLFFKLDYQARKLRGILVNDYKLKP